MKALGKRYLALVLTVLMIISLIGSVTFADGEGTETPGQGTEQQTQESPYSYGMTVGDEISFASLRTAVGITDTVVMAWGAAPDSSVVEFNNTASGTVKAVGAGTTAIEWDGTGEVTHKINITVEEAEQPTYSKTMTVGDTMTLQELAAEVGITDTAVDGFATGLPDSSVVTLSPLSMSGTVTAVAAGETAIEWDSFTATYRINITVEEATTTPKATFMNGSTKVAECEAGEGGIVTPPSDPTEDPTGATDTEFKYWYTTDEATAYNFSTPITGNTTFNAKWGQKTVHTHKWKGSLSDPVTENGKVTVTDTIKCTGEGDCEYQENGFNVTLSAPTGHVTGEAFEATFDTTGIPGALSEEFQVKDVTYYDTTTSEQLESAPTAAGTYRAEAKLKCKKPESGYKDFDKNTLKVTFEITNHNFTYGDILNGERTATCSVEGCPYNTTPAVLKVVADDMYYAGDDIDSSTKVENDPEGLFVFGTTPTYRQGTTVVDSCANPGYYNVQYTFSCNGNVTGNVYKYFTVVEATVEANEDLEQDDGKDLLKTAKVTPSDSGAALVFSLDEEEGDYSEAIPTTDGIEAGDHVVYYKVMSKPANRAAGDAKTLKTGSVDVTVGEKTHVHEWAVEKDGSNSVSITCTDEECKYHETPITVTLTAEGGEYDGKEKIAEIEGEVPDDVADEIKVGWDASGTPTIRIATVPTSAGGTWDDDEGPVDAGNYKAYSGVRVKGYNSGKRVALTQDFEITKKPVTITGLEAEDKTYDGTTAATVKTDNVEIEGLVAGDEGKVELDAIAEGAATFADKDAGEDKAVTLDPTKVTLKGDAAKNYTVDASSIGDLTATINKAPVTVDGITANNKVYDGDTKAELVTDNATFTGKISEEDDLEIAEIGDGEFKDENVGTNKKVTIDPTTIVLGGEDARNYEMAEEGNQTETTAAITALSVKVDGITASDKEYNGNRNATLVTTGATFEGLLDGDTLTIASIGNGTFSDKNVGDGKTVTIDPSTIVLGGDSAGNYSVNVDESQTETTASITARALNIGNSIIAAVNKTYDGNTDAELRIRTDGGRPNSQIYRRITGDDVTVVLAEGAKGSFNNKNVGNNKRVDFTADVLELSGNDKGNYVIGSVGQTYTTANITAKDLTVSGIEAEDKVYDGNTTATLVTDNIVFNGMVEGDDLTLTFNDNAGEFDTRHVGEGKTVTIVWRRNQQNRYTLSGADVGNYNFSRQNSQQTTTASISPAKIKVTAGVGADDKVYDGNVDATLKVVEPVTFDALLNAQDRVSIEVSGIGEFDDKNVGEGKTVTFDPSQITLTGPQAGNYEFDEEGSQSETTASITPKPIKVTGITAKDRYYDGTDDAELLTTGANIEGKIFGDEIFVESASGGKFQAQGDKRAKDAGNGKTVNIDPAGVVLGGTDKDNYSVNPESIQKTTTASIWKLPVEIEWYKEATDTDPAEEPIKYVYNGEKQGPVAKVKNIIEGDKVDVKVIGQEKNAKADPYTAEATQLTGDDADNYTLSSGVKQQYYIDPKPVTVVWTDKTPLVYDGTDKQPDCVVDPSQIVAGDEVEVDDVDVTKDGEKIYWDWDYMVDAATYEFEVTTLDNSNYVLAKDDPSLKHTVVVEQRVAELSWDPTEFIYNGKDRIPEATVTNRVYNVEDRKVDTCNVTAEGAKKDVGDDYTATATELSNKNYKLPDDPTTKFSIKPLEVEIEWSDTEFTYDGKEHMPTATVKNAVEGETLTPVVEAPQTDADTYTATVTGLEPTETAKNYKLPDPLPSTEFTINRAELTVTAADQTISYGDDFDKTKVSYSGWVEGEDESKLDTPATVTSKYFKNSKPGTYDLVPEGASAKNYTIKTVKGKLTVNNKVTVLIAKGKVLTDSKAKLSWTKLSGAKYYKIYFNKCGKKTKYKYLKTVKRNSLNKGGLLKGQCYKFRVVAYDKNGVKIGKSRNIHFVAGKYNSKLTNAKTIKVNKKKLTLTKGQVYTVKAVQTREIGGKKLLDGNHTALFRFISSNKAVATVSKKGAIKGVGKGWCKIYVKAANGLWTTVEVTVK